MTIPQAVALADLILPHVARALVFAFAAAAVGVAIYYTRKR